ncbi:MAG: 50S ribosomal protein L21 [Candidatus Berkelbacteria bacterium]
MFAVIEIKGVQYRIEQDLEFKIDKIESEENILKVSEVLLIEDGDNVKVGTPYVDKAFVELELIENIKDKKVLVEKFKSKVRYKRRFGHRQQYTVAKVKNINYEK